MSSDWPYPSTRKPGDQFDSERLAYNLQEPRQIVFAKAIEMAFRTVESVIEPWYPS
jgi:hypothetical protein